MCWNSERRASPTYQILSHLTICIIYKISQKMFWHSFSFCKVSLQSSPYLIISTKSLMYELPNELPKTEDLTKWGNFRKSQIEGRHDLVASLRSRKKNGSNAILSIESPTSLDFLNLCQRFFEWQWLLTFNLLSNQQNAVIFFFCLFFKKNKCCINVLDFLVFLLILSKHSVKK